MGLKTDIVLADTMELKAKGFTFKHEDTSNDALRLVVPPSGGSQLTLCGGAAASEVAGFFLLDHGGDPLVAIRKGPVVAADMAKTRVFVDGQRGNVVLGGNQSDGDLVLRGPDGATMVHISASVGPEAPGVAAYLSPEANVRMSGTGIVEVAGFSTLKMMSGTTTTVQLNGGTGLVDARDVALGVGETRIASLLTHIRALTAALTAMERRIATLEAKK